MYGIPSKPSKTMVSTTEVGGDKTPNGQVAWKNKPKSDKKKPMEFTGGIKVDRVLYQKVLQMNPIRQGKL